MKRIIKLLLLILISLNLIGCFSNNSNNTGPFIEGSIEIKQFKVYFVIDGKSQYYKNVTDKQIFTPIDHIEKENHTFIGWFFENGTKYDFDYTLKKETYLYAKYEPDYTKLINKVSTEIIKSNVKIYTTSYNTFLGIITKSIIGQGSGIIINEWDNGSYAVLTNAHVAHKQNEYDNVKYQIEDYKGNKYTGFLYYNAIDINYDLAILYFSKNSEDLEVIEMTYKNPIINEDIITIGQPNGQNNSITFGKVLSYQKNTLSDSTYSNVNFPIMKHNSPSASGSSGGAIINTNLELVGLHYAGSEDSKGNFISGSAIPIEKIREFLNIYVYKK